MKKSREFENILDECLERILSRGETVEQCLARYPGQAEELKPLLETVVAAKQATSIQPRSEFREKARYEFQAAIRLTQGEKARGFFSWMPQWATVVAVILIVLVAGGGGTVAAAGDSMPDEPLYQVKLATERVRLAFTPSSLGKVELYVKLADERIAEIAEMVDRGKAEKAGQATGRLNTHLVAMTSLAAPATPEKAMMRAPAPALAPQAVEEEAAVAKAPKAEEVETPQVLSKETPQVVIKEAPEPEPKVIVREAQRGKQHMAPGRPETGPGIVEERTDEDEELAGIEQEARLRIVLARRAMENPEILRALLERAPESVKQALLEAIELSDIGYQQVLEALEELEEIEDMEE